MRLIPLANIPATARTVEREARRSVGSRAAALEAANWRLVSAPGCHGRPPHDPPVIGWVLTEAAAIAVSSQLTHMPDGSAHKRLTYEYVG